MNILPMLVRLQGALGRDDLVDRMILIPSSASHQASEQGVNLVVGYDSSPKSQVALDVTLWIAYQTRIATHRQVTVQVVYVVKGAPQWSAALPSLSSPSAQLPTRTKGTVPFAGASPSPLVEVRDLLDVRNKSHPLAEQRSTSRSYAAPNAGANRRSAGRSSSATLVPASTQSSVQTVDFEAADRILWQARCLADEWRGSLKTHLRFGEVTTELRRVVQEESATLLVVGCESAEAPLIQVLGDDFPCPVLGIPPELHT